MVISKIHVIPAGIAGIQSQGWYLPNSVQLKMTEFFDFRYFYVIISVHVHVNWIPAIPAGMTDRFIVAIFNNDEKTQNPILSLKFL